MICASIYVSAKSFHYQQANKARVSGGGDPWAGIKKLEEQQRAEQKHHQRRSVGFGMLAERLIENEVYRLSKANCDEIELFDGDGK